MNPAKNTLSIALALTLLVPLAGCGLTNLKKGLNGAFVEGLANSKEGSVVTASIGPSADAAKPGDRVPDLAGTLAADAPDIVALRDAGGPDDAVEQLLEELWRDGLDYAVASRSDDHAVLVRRDAGIRVADAHHGRYASGRGSWAGAVLDAPYGTLTVVATDVMAADVAELLDVLAFGAGETVVACSRTDDDAATRALLDEGFGIELETPEGDVLLTRNPAN